MTYNILIKLCIEVLTYFMFEDPNDVRTLDEIKLKIHWIIKDWYGRQGKTARIENLNVYFKYNVLDICLVLEDKKYQLNFILAPYDVNALNEIYYQFDLEASAYFESNNITYNTVIFHNMASIPSAPLLATTDNPIKCLIIEKGSVVDKDKLIYPLMKWAKSNEIG